MLGLSLYSYHFGWEKTDLKKNLKKHFGSWCSLVSGSQSLGLVKPRSRIRALRSSLVMMLEPEVHLEALKLPPLFTQKGHPPKKNPLGDFWFIIYLLSVVSFTFIQPLYFFISYIYLYLGFLKGCFWACMPAWIKIWWAFFCFIYPVIAEDSRGSSKNLPSWQAKIAIIPWSKWTIPLKHPCRVEFQPLVLLGFFKASSSNPTKSFNDKISIYQV